MRSNARLWSPINLGIPPSIHRKDPFHSHVFFQLVKRQFDLGIILGTTPFRLIEICRRLWQIWIQRANLQVILAPRFTVLRVLVGIKESKLGSALKDDSRFDPFGVRRIHLLLKVGVAVKVPNCQIVVLRHTPLLVSDPDGILAYRCNVCECSREGCQNILIGDTRREARHERAAPLDGQDTPAVCLVTRASTWPETDKVEILSASSVASSGGPKRYVLFRNQGCLGGSGEKTHERIW